MQKHAMNAGIQTWIVVIARHISMRQVLVRFFLVLPPVIDLEAIYQVVVVRRFKARYVVLVDIYSTPLRAPLEQRAAEVEQVHLPFIEDLRNVQTHGVRRAT